MPLKSKTSKKPAPKSKGKKSQGFEPYPNSLAVFKNENASGEKSPSHTGRITLGAELLEAIRDSEGEFFEVELALWPKKSKKGNRYLSGLVKLPYEADKDEEEEDEDKDWDKDEEEEEEDEDDF